MVDWGAVGLSWRRRRWYHAEVPISIIFQSVQYILSVGMHQVGPRLPKRVDDVVYKPDLGEQSKSISRLVEQVTGSLLGTFR